MDATDTTEIDYKRTFSTDSGRRVLGNMLVEAKFFSETHTPEEQAVENFMKIVLAKCGTYRIANIDEYVLNVLKMQME